MRRLFLTAVVLLGFALPSAAQTRPDPAAIESARALIEETGVARTFDAILGPMAQQMSQLLQMANPDHGRVISQLVDELVIPDLRRRAPEFLELMTLLYAQHFTASEMDELRNFYRTPTGRKFVEKQTTLALEGQRVGQIWGRRAAIQALERLLPELERRGLKAPKI
jgi:uncharacterized protein